MLRAGAGQKMLRTGAGQEMLRQAQDCVRQAQEFLSLLLDDYPCINNPCLNPNT
jgi:hypothetical protein